MGIGGDASGSIVDQLLAVSTWLRGRYESAPAAELAMLAAVIAYLETLAERVDAPGRGGAAADETDATPDGEGSDRPGASEPHWSQALGEGPETRGVFRETAGGGTVTDEAGDVRELPYVVVEAAGLRHGDCVRIRPQGDLTGNCFYTRTGATAPVMPSRVREGVGVLARRGHHLSVTVDGRVMRAAAAHPRLGGLHDGAPVSVRYDLDSSQQSDAVAYVVRVHDSSASPGPPAGHRTLRPLRVAEGVAPASEAVAPTIAVPAEGSLPRILIVGGHPRARLHYGEAMSHVAQVEWVHGQRVTPSLRRRVETARAIVLVTQHMTHPVSHYIMRVLRETHKPSIRARSQNHSGLARQIVQELLPQLDPVPPALGAPDA